MPASWMYFTAVSMVRMSAAASLKVGYESESGARNCNVRPPLVIVSFGTDSIKELPSRAQVET